MKPIADSGRSGHRQLMIGQHQGFINYRERLRMTSPRPIAARILTGTVIAITALGVATGCSSTTTSNPSPSTTTSNVVNGHNVQDETFLADMIAHHQQAIDMAQMVPSHTKNPKVRTLASQIEAAQGPEIAKMQAWLDEWSEGKPSASAHSSAPGMDDNMPGMDHGGASAGDPSAPGMMTAQEMAQLESKSGAAFDKLWLTMMIAHHQGAITMSQQELAKGENAQVKAVAEGIIDGQTKEIATMKAMLA